MSTKAMHTCTGGFILVTPVVSEQTAQSWIQQSFWSHCSFYKYLWHNWLSDFKLWLPWNKVGDTYILTSSHIDNSHQFKTISWQVSELCQHKLCASLEYIQGIMHKTYTTFQKLVFLQDFILLCKDALKWSKVTEKIFCNIIVNVFNFK